MVVRMLLRIYIYYIGCSFTVSRFQTLNFLLGQYLSLYRTYTWLNNLLKFVFWKNKEIKIVFLPLTNVIVGCT